MKTNFNIMDIQKTRDEIIIAYLFLRKHENIISSESLKFMKRAADEKLEQLELTAVVQAKPEKFCVLKSKVLLDPEVACNCKNYDDCKE